MGAPTPRTMEAFMAEVNLQIALLQRRKQGSSGSAPTDPTPAATETVAGKARLATKVEAEGNSTATAIMTPQRVRDAIAKFSLAAGRGGFSVGVGNWNTALKSGMYFSNSDALNSPEASGFVYYVGLVHNMSVDGIDGSSIGTIMQEVWQWDYVNNVATSLGHYRRFGEPTQESWTSYIWGPWVADEGAEPATQTTAGIVELATLAEVLAGGDSTRVVTPATLAGRTATDERSGLIELATSAEVLAGTDSQKAVTPNSLTTRTATESRTGLAELATAEEVQAGTDDVRIVTPAGLASRTATTDRTGIVELATDEETVAGLRDDAAVTPAGLATRLETSLPPRLSDTGQQVMDWNDAESVGFYWSDPTALNVPPSSPTQLLGTVTAGLISGVPVIIQELSRAGDSQTVKWSRYRNSSGVWASWVPAYGGDTGWVDLSSYSLSAGSIQARKVGEMVTVHGVNMAQDLPEMTTAATFMNAIPAQFRPFENAWGMGYVGAFSLPVLIDATGIGKVGNRGNTGALITSSWQFSLTYLAA